jgi:3-oxoacyl-[acyl-carrier protein] reductase
MMFSLQGKTAWVSGSTQGIGLASAEGLARMGARIILVARNPDKLASIVSTLPRPANQDHQWVVADFSKPEEVDSAARNWLLNNPEGIDILVNNSGGPQGGLLTETRFEEFNLPYEQHLICNHLLMLCFLEGMKKKGFGRIINIISTSVKQPLKGLGVSNTIRGAVANWAKSLANEVAPWGITVNNVLPGATATERLSLLVNTKAKRTGSDTHAVEDEMRKEIPAGRFAMPEEIAAAVVFLASNEAAYINGINLPVDGGRTACL